MRLLLSALLLAVPATALAQPTRTADVQTMATDDCARARKAGKTCVLTIEDESIVGASPRAGETSLTAIEWGSTSSLIQLRRDFIPEILRTAEDID